MSQYVHLGSNGKQSLVERTYTQVSHRGGCQYLFGWLSLICILQFMVNRKIKNVPRMKNVVWSSQLSLVGFVVCSCFMR